MRVVKNVIWRQRITNEVLYVGLPRISTTIRKRCLRFSGHCWRSKNEAVNDLVLWEPKHGKGASEDRLAHLSLSCRRTPRSLETACWQPRMTELAGERETMGVD